MPALSLIVAGPDGPAADVQHVLVSWVRAGLVEPALWVERGSAAEIDDNTSPVARRLTGSEGELVSVIDEVARHKVSTVRVVTVHLATGSDSDTTLLDDADSLATAVRHFLAPTQRLERLNVVIPASGVRHLEPTLIADHAVKHVIVSPEDRVSERHASRQIGWPDGGYAGHAALAIATIAGTWWATGDEAPFDTEHFTASGERAQAVVTRSFARILRGGRLGARITSEVFNRRRVEAWTAAAVDAVDAPNPEQIMEDLAAGIENIEGRPIVYRAADPLPLPARKTVGVLRAFSMMLRFIFGRLRQAPSQIAGRVVEGVRQAVEGFAQRVTFGSESTVQVGFGGRATGESLTRIPSMLAADHAVKLLRDLGRNASPPATAGLWQALRRVSFGLIDAGPFPDEVKAPMDGARRLVVNDATFVVADPDDRFLVDRDVLGPTQVLPPWVLEPIPAWDVARLADLRRLLRAELELAQAGGERESALGEDAEEVDPDPELAQRLEGILADLERYAQRHGTSLMWRLSDRLSTSLRSASNAFMTALRRVQQGDAEDEGNKMALAAQWLRRRWILVFLVALLVPAAAWYLADQGLWEPVWGAVIVTAVVVWLIGWFVSFIGYQRRVFRIQYDIDRRRHEFLNAIVQVEHNASEVVRLASLYDQFVDWAEVMAWMVHHPEGHLEDEPDESLPTPEQAPLALRVADGLPSEDTLRRTSAVIGRGVFNRGWLGGLYADYAGASIKALKYELGLPDDAPDPDPDRDITGTPPPRRSILEQVRAGTHASSWHDRVRTQVDVALATVPPGELFDSVRGVTGADGIPDIAPTDFLADVVPAPGGEDLMLMHQTWRTDAQFNDPARVTRTVMWAPVDIATSTSDTVEVRGAHLADRSMGEAFVLSLVRCDVTKGSTASDFDLFRSPEAPSDPGSIVIEPGEIG